MIYEDYIIGDTSPTGLNQGFNKIVDTSPTGFNQGFNKNLNR